MKIIDMPSKGRIEKPSSLAREEGLGDGSTATPKAGRKPLYYVKDRVVWKRPIGTRTRTGMSYTLGFPVCELCDGVTDDVASAIAAALNTVEPASPEQLP